MKYTLKLIMLLLVCIVIGCKNPFAPDSQGECRFVLTKLTDINKMGEMRYLVFEYNDHGDASGHKQYKQDNTLLYMENSGYEYDSYGRIITRIDTPWYNDSNWLNANRLFDYVRWERFAYDSAGNIRTVTGTFHGHIRYEYDQYGKRVKSIQEKSSGKTIITKYEYNEMDFLIKTTCENRIKEKKTGESWSIYTYDEAGNMIREDQCDTNEVVYKTHTYEYDAAGNKIRHVETIPGRGSKTDEYEYDVDGNVIKEISYNEEGEIQWTALYEYRCIVGNPPPKVDRYCVKLPWGL